MKKKAKIFLLHTLNAIVIIVPLIVGITLLLSTYKKPPETIKVGILHSTTGPMAAHETLVLEATLLAIEEINKQGGILGKIIEPIIADGKSNPTIFDREAQNLITEHKASTIFGCWTSPDRKHVKNIVEKNNALLFYPGQHEGLEDINAIIYTGACPNQYAIPGIAWVLNNIGKKIFFVGSDDIYSHTLHKIIEPFIQTFEGTIVGNAYIPTTSENHKKIIEKIKATKPAAIINAIGNHTVISFFKQLRKGRITPEVIPTMSLTLTENDISAIDPNLMDGDYVTLNYVYSLNNKKNNTFTRKMHEKIGSSTIITGQAQNAYLSVHLWAQAVQKSNSTDVSTVKEAIKSLSIKAPEGAFYIDKNYLHAWKTVRIGEIIRDGSIAILWSSKKPIAPDPFPTFKTKEEWQAIVQDFYNSWGKQWQKSSSKLLESDKSDKHT